MSLRTRQAFRALLIATFSTALLSSGCASLDLSMLNVAGKAPPAPAIGPDTPTFFVELHGGGAKPRRATMPLGKPTLASDVFSQMKGRPFTRFKSYIVRQTPNGELRLPLHWEGDRSGVVTAASDYAIYPNDRLLIVENSNTFVDDIVADVMGPFASWRK